MYDYHNHTDWSPDGSAFIDDMIQAAIAKGIREFAITDHEDPESHDLNFVDLDFDLYLKMLNEAADRWNRPDSPIRIIRGIELGLRVGSVNRKCKEIATTYKFDFILGAVHGACGYDIDQMGYLSKRTPEQAISDYYETMLYCLDDYDDFDSFAHINNVDRYIPLDTPDSLSAGYIEAALKKLVDMGKGIEVNTSSYRKGMGTRTTPTLSTLKLFRSLGGEIVTIGSDAHQVDDVGSGLREGIELIKAAGFSAITTFHERKPTFVDIDTI